MMSEALTHESLERWSHSMSVSSRWKRELEIGLLLLVYGVEGEPLWGEGEKMARLVQGVPLPTLPRWLLSYRS